MEKKFLSYQEEKQYFETETTEAVFLEWYQKQELPSYKTPSVTVDNVLMCYNKSKDQLKILLIKRNTHPFQYSWALPGGFVEENESTEESCIRETKEETGVAVTLRNIDQLYTFSTPRRDPRGWVITVSYLAFIGEDPLVAGDDAKAAIWFDLELKHDTLILSNENEDQIRLDLMTGASIGKENLAFDHNQIILKAFNRVSKKMYHEPEVLQVLGETFTITEARKVFAKFLGTSYKEIDHSNFKKIMLPYFTEVGEKPSGIGRPSKLYKLSSLV